MASYLEQFEAARVTNLAVRGLEATSRKSVETIFLAAASGELSINELRVRVLSQLRSSYRSSAALGLAHISRQIGVQRWQPVSLEPGVLNSDYLRSLVRDVGRNVRAFQSGEQDSQAKRDLLSRLSHSVGVAAARGYTDALIMAAVELEEDHGFILKKIWRANFDDHTPCPMCAELNGTSVPLNKEFKTDANRLKVYGDLKGPPRHPRCMCWLVILVDGLDTYLDDIESPRSEPVQKLTTAEVREMEPSFFKKIVLWLRKFLHKLGQDS